MKQLSPDSIIFDLDGTLWDASNACAKAWNFSLTQAGIPGREVTDEFIRSVSGLRIDIVMDTHFNFISRDKQEVVLDFYRVNEKEHMRNQGGILYPGLLETLSILKTKYDLFIVSNCLSGYIENFLERNQLNEFFKDFECSGNTNLPKNENIRLVIERNQLQSPVYVGDTIWDSEAASKAGLPFIYAAYGFGSVENGTTSINSIAELVSILKPADQISNTK